MCSYDSIYIIATPHFVQVAVIFSIWLLLAKDAYIYILQQGVYICIMCDSTWDHEGSVNAIPLGTCEKA